LHALSQLIVEVDLLVGVGVFRGRQNHGHRQQVVSLEADVCLQQPQQALHHQSRTDQQHDCEGDLSDNESAAQTMSGAGGRLASTFFESFVKIET